MSAVVNTDMKAKILASFKEANFTEALDSRKQAIVNFERLGLPSNKNEEYRFTPVTRNLETFNWEDRMVPSSLGSINEFLIPGLDANILVFVNGIYAKHLSKISSSKEQLTIKSLREALTSDKAFIDLYFDKLVNSSTDPFAALNSAFWQDGVFVYIPENSTVEKPLFILHIQDSSVSSLISHTRLLLLAGKNSHVTVYEKFDSVGPNPVFHTFTEELVLEEKAQLEYCKIQNDAGHSYQVANTMIRQADASKVNTFTLTLNGRLVRNNLGITIDGENCESHFYGLYLLNSSTLADNHTVVDHRKPNSFSNELYKGILDDNAKGVFNGKIFVRPYAQKTNAFQSNRNILISEAATVNTKPQLEIWADDVKCSHGCTTGQLDEEAVFYLQSRGISKTTAKAMLQYAFAAEVLEPIQNAEVKTYLDQLISERLHKDF